METNKIKTLKNKYYKVWSYALFASTIVFIIIAAVYNFTQRTFYFFDHRYDVVLSNSMSGKSEKYADFLKGHDDQIQKMDLVDSKRIYSDTPLNIYDIVLFDEPTFGTDMHRIVDKEIEGDIFNTRLLISEEYQGHKTFSFETVLAQIKSEEPMTYHTLKMVTYSPEPLETDYYNIFVNQAPITPQISSVEVSGGLYKNTIKHTRGTEFPARFALYKKNYKMYDHIESITLEGSKKSYIIDSSYVNASLYDEPYNGRIILNPREKFLIRGDMNENEDGDGWFYREQLYSKVTNIIPKGGYIVRYVTSPFGLVLIVGLILIPIVAKFIYDKKKNKKIEGENK